MSALNAKNLKNELWETLQDLRTSKVDPRTADSIASQAREIIRTINTQLTIASMAKTAIPPHLVDFSETVID